MDEFCNKSYENAKIYKERTKAWHDKHIVRKEFVPGQQVFPYGAVEVTHDEKGTFTVNGQRLKHYRNGESIGKRDDIPLTSS